MKTKYFTIIVLFSTNLLLGQSYIPMLVEENQWNVMYYDGSFGPEHPYDTWETIKYNVGDDVNIDGLNYIEINNDNGIQLYREDTTEKKIYLRHETDDESWDELLYDFSMKLGDTLNYYQNHKDGEIHYTIRVDSIVNIELGNGFKTRKFYNSCKVAGWENEFHHCGNWIEGMGTFHGIYPIQKIGITGNYITITLLCFKKNDELIYMNPDFESCDENSNAINEIGYKRLKILTNPVNDNLSVELPEEEVWTDYVITNISGKNILSNNIKKSLINLNINVYKLQSGLYFVRVKNRKGKFAIGKFIVD
jgi:hypothetical protein